MGNNLHFIRKLLILDMPGVFVKKIEDKFWGQWTDKKKSCHIQTHTTPAIYQSWGSQGNWGYLDVFLPGKLKKREKIFL